MILAQFKTPHANDYHCHKLKNQINNQHPSTRAPVIDNKAMAEPHTSAAAEGSHRKQPPFSVARIKR